MNSLHTFLLVMTAAAATLALRAAPFVIFGRGKKLPEAVSRLAKRLPPAIMAALLIYCIKSDIYTPGRGSICTAAALLLVVTTYLKFKNTLLSVCLATAAYMLFIRIFA